MICNATVIETFNFSIYPYMGDNTETVITWREQLKIYFYVLVIFVALVGNSMVIAAVGANRSMRTTINCYLVNLAVADILICVFCMWVHLVNHVSKLYILGAFFCKVNGFAQMTCLTASVLTLTAISFDRLIAIMWPLHVRITKQRTSAVISIVWVISTLVSIPFLVYRKHYELYWEDFLETTCLEAWPQVQVYDEESNHCIQSYPLKTIYYTIVSVTLFFIPVLVMSTAYGLIIGTLWKTRLPGEVNETNITLQHRAKKKVIQMVCVVLMVFAFCWTPLQILVLYSIYSHSSGKYGELPEWFSEMEFYATFIAYSNSAMNPIIYGGFNQSFRQNMLAVMRCAWNRYPLRRPTGSQRSRNTLSSGITFSPSQGRTGRNRINNGSGVFDRQSEVSLKSYPDKNRNLKLKNQKDEKSVGSEEVFL